MGLVIKEKVIEYQILTWLETQRACGFPCIAWKNQSVGVYDPVKGVYRKAHSHFNRNGVSDILGIWNGKFLAIEVKSMRGRLSEYQKSFIEDVTKNGGIAIVARSVEDVKHALAVNDSVIQKNTAERRSFFD